MNNTIAHAHANFKHMLNAAAFQFGMQSMPVRVREFASNDKCSWVVTVGNPTKKLSR